MQYIETVVFSDVMVNKWAYADVTFFYLTLVIKSQSVAHLMQNTLNMCGEAQYFSVETRI